MMIKSAVKTSLLFLQALHLVHCRSGSSSLSSHAVNAPVFGIRKEEPSNSRQSFVSASGQHSLENLPQLFLRGGETANFSTWSDQIPQPFLEKEFSVIKTGDGSEEDPDGIPKRYLIAHKDNREKAKAAFEHTLEWRREEQVNTILLEPPANFDLCHQIFPVFLPGRDSEGHLILVQRPGMVRLDIASANDISVDAVLRHYLYIVEYVWNLLDPSPMPPGGLMTSIIDCTGVKMDMVYNTQFRTFGKELVGIMSNHYPTRSYKTLIINAPKWIKLAFNLVKPLMRESTRKKIVILNSGPDQDKILKELLGGEDSLPYYLRSSSESSSEDSSSSEEEDLSEIEKELRLVASVGLKECAVVVEEEEVTAVPVATA
ncbi:unnamed protein product [Cylindrotheca closterium]|uniref:CRAL-TRIO domain-containing protein n=1 Tax=Cylindrotheca closterium TaxID=2856 RepID=A0AAD2PVI6_9STRA|nr:unnamed protein product [Cylindrotheca closterium]